MQLLSRINRTIADSPRRPTVLTIDTEPDDAWSDHLCESVANVRALRRLAPIMRRYGVRPTLLVTWRVIHDPECREILLALVQELEAEVGAHLHPWENPPFLPDRRDVRFATFPHELPLESFAEKMRRLTDAIGAHFGPPRSYRAGRWGLDPAHIRVLEELGYEADTSVYPLMDWRSTVGIPRSEGGVGGVDYRSAPCGAYRLSYDDLCRNGTSRIVEVPVTAGLNRSVWPAFLADWIPHAPILLQRALRKLGIARTVWMTPAWETRRHLLEMTQTVLSADITSINIACHSSELSVCRLPECSTPEKIDEVFARFESLFTLLAEDSRTEFLTLTAAARRFAAIASLQPERGT